VVAAIGQLASWFGKTAYRAQQIGSGLLAASVM